MSDGSVVSQARGASMRFRQIFYFQQVLALGSLRRASAHLGVKPSTLSRGIRDLEVDVGCPLLIRSPSGVLPTEAGRVFLKHTFDVTESIDRAIADARVIGVARKRAIRVGVCYEVSTGIVRARMDDYASKFPHVKIEMMYGDVDYHFKNIIEENIDISILGDVVYDERFESKHLWNEDLYVASAICNEQLRKAEIDWRDLIDYEFLVTEHPPGRQHLSRIEEGFGGLGRQAPVRTLPVSRDVMMYLVGSSSALTLASAGSTDIPYPGILYTKIKNQSISFHAIWKRGRDIPHIRKFLEP